MTSALLPPTKSPPVPVSAPTTARPNTAAIASSASAAGAQKASPGEEVMDTVVRELNEALRGSTMDLHLRIGQLVIDRLYGGDLNAWRAQGPKEASFERLAARAGHDLLVSASSLYRAVALFELTERLAISKWKSLGVSHLRAVLGLPDRDQRPLLSAAEREKWTVKRLEAEVSKLRSSADRRRGRPPLPAFIKTVHRIAKALVHPMRDLSGLDHLDRLTHVEIVRLHGLVAQAREHLQVLETRLAAALRNKNTSHIGQHVSTRQGRA